MSILKDFDDSFRSPGNIIVAGFDEAGRGPLCGPVVAAGVILPPEFDDGRIDDSKKLNARQRDLLFELIKANALCYRVEVIDAPTIDRINILEASRLGMQKALDYFLNQGFQPTTVITDYMKVRTASCLVAIKHGDCTSLSVAAASILAKVTRDRIMIDLDKIYPGYGFARHKGYGTPEHLEALEKLGIIRGLYRESFEPVRRMLERSAV